MNHKLKYKYINYTILDILILFILFANLFSYDIDSFWSLMVCNLFGDFLIKTNLIFAGVSKVYLIILTFLLLSGLVNYLRKRKIPKGLKINRFIFFILLSITFWIMKITGEKLSALKIEGFSIINDVETYYTLENKYPNSIMDLNIEKLNLINFEYIKNAEKSYSFYLRYTHFPCLIYFYDKKTSEFQLLE